MQAFLNISLKNSISIYLNGKKVADTIQTDATIYPSGMLVAHVIPTEEESLSLGYTKHYYAGAQRVSSKIGTTENLGDYLYDWFTQGTGGPIDVIGSSFGVLENAEDGVIQVYEEFDIEPPTYESTPVFIPVQSFIHGGNELEQYYFHPDHLGSTSYITNLLGEVSQHMEYFAFGETFVEEHRSSNNSPYKFNGKELDEETGWYYYGARYYDPRISIWLSVDPLAEQTMTPYVYVNNNPVNLIDPTGMKSETWIVNRDSGEATYIDDGSEDIVIVQGNEYNTIIELGQDATGECTGDCNLDSWDMYQDYLKQGERHTSENFSTGNKKADNNIMSLDPRARTPMILSVIQARLEGIDVRGAYLGNHRTYAEQNELYKQGRTKPGGIVTNAVGGQSNHNFGMAMDVAIFDNGKYLKEGTEWQYRRFGEIAESNGLEWGGRWTSPFDPAHVQIKHGYSMKELRALPKDKKGHIIAPLIKEQ